MYLEAVLSVYTIIIQYWFLSLESGARGFITHFTISSMPSVSCFRVRSELALTYLNMANYTR
jgi:hypothetical protein